MASAAEVGVKQKGKVRVLVLLAAGVNCDRETAHAFESAGAVADRIHINDLIANPHLPADYRILALSGGFSFGDDIASGQVLARKLKHRLAEPIARFVDDGKLIIGICNGFQVLVKLGLLPGGRSSNVSNAPLCSPQQAALTFNGSAKFEDRWVYLKVEAQSNCVFTKDLNKLYLPVRHGEGRFVISDEGLEKLKAAGQVVLRYADKDGRPVAKTGPESKYVYKYPDNPNDSIDNIAGICDSTGRIFGLMPHPEVFIRPTQHPRWTREKNIGVDGIEIFKNAVEFASK